MFTNLSNHPSSGWPEEQYSYASSRWGRISDLPFPVLNPDKSEEEILQLVKKYLNLLPPKEEGPVFVAGEYTFTYAMVDALLRFGFRAMYVQSENIVRSAALTDGRSERTMQYHFVRFADYERIPGEFEVMDDFEPVFLNCSFRYASSGWDQEARRQASCYGRILDLPRPPITGTREERFEKVGEYLREIDRVRPSAVLLDGEFGTFFLMADALLRKGYRVLVKCSERRSRDKTDQEGNVTKISEYRFVRYRHIAALTFETQELES